MMDPIERVLRIRGDIAYRGWGKQDFALSKTEGYRRWRETIQVFEIQYRLFGDAVALVAPEFGLSSDEERAVNAVEVPAGSNCPHYVLISFVKWERCSVTQGFPNPYEPWIEVWEHGGGISVEHANYVDITFRDADIDGQIRYGSA